MPCTCFLMMLSEAARGQQTHPEPPWKIAARPCVTQTRAAHYTRRLVA